MRASRRRREADTEAKFEYPLACFFTQEEWQILEEVLRTVRSESAEIEGACARIYTRLATMRKRREGDVEADWFRLENGPARLAAEATRQRNGEGEGA